MLGPERATRARLRSGPDALLVAGALQTGPSSRIRPTARPGDAASDPRPTAAPVIKAIIAAAVRPTRTPRLGWRRSRDRAPALRLGLNVRRAGDDGPDGAQSNMRASSQMSCAPPRRRTRACASISSRSPSRPSRSTLSALLSRSCSSATPHRQRSRRSPTRLSGRRRSC
jgi:hypothetical protein